MEAVALYEIPLLLEFQSKNQGKNIDYASIVQNKDYKYNSLSKSDYLKATYSVLEDLKETHENLIRYLLGSPEVKMRWIDGYFPFTEPSLELEVFFNDQWVEMLGCGIFIRGDS